MHLLAPWQVTQDDERNVIERTSMASSLLPEPRGASMEFLERRFSAEMCVAETRVVNRGHRKAYGIRK